MRKNTALFIIMVGCVFALQAQITVNSPKAGDNWSKKGTYSITWSWPGSLSQPVVVKLFQGSAHVLNIEKNVSGGICSWGVPESLADGTYTIRVKAVNQPIEGISKPFTISTAAVTMMARAKVPPAQVLQNLKVQPFSKLMVQAYPNPAVTRLTYQIGKQVNQFSMELKIIGVVENIGPAEFKYSGTATLYRGNNIAVQKNFANLASRQSFTIDYSVSEGFDFTAQGIYFPVDYLLKITYTPGIQAKPEEIDGDMSNNENKLLGTTVATDAYEAYAKNYRQQLTSLINQYRQANGLGALALDGCISQAAQGHSEWMKTTNSFSHTGKNGSGHATRCQQAGCSCSSETIYNGGMSPPDAFNAWKGSAGHNAIMLGAFSKIGIGICSGWITADYQ